MTAKTKPTRAQLDAEWATLRQLQDSCRGAIAQRDELLTALMEADEDFERDGYPEDSPYRAHIRAVIARVTLEVSGHGVRR